MPPRGPRPKPAGQAVTRHKQTHDWIDVPDVPFNDAPELPPARANGQPWPERTVQKWRTWSTMPHCVLWTDAEWDYALDSLEMAANFHESSEVKFATELRNREKVLGTTLDFRRALRIRYIDAVEEPRTMAGVANLADYREL